jgi:hypothetical protein
VRRSHLVAVTTAALATLAVAAGAAAAPRTGHGILHSPHGSYRGHSAGYWTSQWWAGALSTPAGEDNPAFSGGCVLRGKVALSYGGDCTVPPGTSIFLMLFSTECSNREPDPFHAESAAEAEACGRANVGTVERLDIRVDGGPWLHLLDDAYATAMPWTTVPWPEDNIFGLPGGGEISFGGYGYVALLRPLSRGTHTIEQDFAGEGAPPPNTITITVG